MRLTSRNYPKQMELRFAVFRLRGLTMIKINVYALNTFVKNDIFALYVCSLKNNEYTTPRVQSHTHTQKFGDALKFSTHVSCCRVPANPHLGSPSRPHESWIPSAVCFPAFPYPFSVCLLDYLRSKKNFLRAAYSTSST